MFLVNKLMYSKLLIKHLLKMFPVVKINRTRQFISFGHLSKGADASGKGVEDLVAFGLGEAGFLKLLLLVALLGGSGLGVATIDHPVGQLAIRDVLQLTQCVLLGERQGFGLLDVDAPALAKVRTWSFRSFTAKAILDEFCPLII